MMIHNDEDDGMMILPDEVNVMMIHHDEDDGTMIHDDDDDAVGLARTFPLYRRRMIRCPVGVVVK